MNANCLPSTHSPRILTFPSARPLGWVYGHPRVEQEQIPWSWGLLPSDTPTAGQVRLAAAQGTVTVPTGLDVELVLNDQATADLAPLRGLHLDALQIITAPHTRLADDQLVVLHRFRELLALDLASTMVTSPAINRLPWLEQLHHFAYSGGSRRQLTDAAAAWLNRCLNLRTLSIFGGDLCGDGLRPLLDMPHLHTLRFGSTNAVTSVGWAIIGQLPYLTSLDLVGSNIQDDDLAYLGQLTNLCKLDLYGTEVRGHGLRFLRHLDHLTSLRLSWIEDDGSDQVWAPLCELAALEELDVSESTFGISALEYLTRLSNLQTLKVARCRFAATPPSLVWLRAFPRLTVLDMGGTAVDDSSLSVLITPQLQTLSLSKTKVTDQGLPTLQPLQQLRSLDLSYTVITDTGLKELQVLHGLQEVILHGTYVHGPGLRYLSQLPTLRTVWLGGRVPVAADCTEYLQPHTQLQECHLLSSGATGQTLRYLQPCRQLRALTLTAATLNADDLIFLQQFPQLVSLDLTECILPDVGLELLEQLGQLEFLCLAKTNMSKQAIEALQYRLPNCSMIDP